MSDQIRFAVLGPVRVWRGDTEIDAGPPQQRVLLAMLLARVGRPVAIDDLIAAIWEEPPASAINTVHRYIGSLRRLLEPGLQTRRPGRWIRRHGAAYVLAGDPSTVDLLRLRETARAARALASPDAATRRFAEALALWNGPCAAGSQPTPQAYPVLAAVDRECAAVAAQAAEVALHSSEPVVAALRPIVAWAGLDERLQACWIRLLAANGKQAEALDQFRAVRDRLADELGVDPGPELSAAFHAVLAQSGGPAGPPPAAPPPDPFPPAQLPSELPAFGGRDAEVARIVHHLSGCDGRASVTVITGMAGVGKTTLAVRAAHQIADRFPDGQLYVNLHGFDDSAATEPGEALRGLLAALGAEPNRIPTGLDAQAGLYRSLLAGRNVLVVLDNARDVRQVAALLPAGTGCAAIVTSRSPLTGLLVNNGAEVVTLDLLSPADARDLLCRRIGAARVAAEPGPASDIVTMCGRLPLALAIAAARAEIHRTATLATIAAELRAARGSLDAFAGNDPQIDARAVFSWSYTKLGPDAAALFRLMSVHPAPDLSVAAAASLIGRPPRPTRQLLAELTDTRLLTEPRPGRFATHDLIRAYATELCQDTDPAADRASALDRVLDHYLHTARAGSAALRSRSTPSPASPPRPGVTTGESGTRADALTWFTAEHHNLATMIGTAAESGRGGVAWRMALTMQQFLHWKGYWHDWVYTMTVGLAAAEDAADMAGQAEIHRSLAGAFMRLGFADDARVHLDHALRMFTAVGGPAEMGMIHDNIAELLAAQGRFAEAAESCRRARELCERAGDRRGVASATIGLGECLRRLGRHEEAIVYAEAAKTFYLAENDSNMVAGSLHLLALSYCQTGRHDLAVRNSRQAIRLLREVGNRSLEADSLVVLGDALLGLGDPAQARAEWEQALARVDRSQAPTIARIRSRLRELTAEPADAA